MTATDDLLKTPLTDLHVEHGGKLVAFAGYAMPVQFSDGVLKEHLHTRAHAGLFDVSHMGQVTITAKSGLVEDAASALERLVPVNVLGLKPGRQRYAFFTNPEGGILDDFMVANRGDHLFLVANAACKTADIAHLKANLSDECVIEELADRALIALQGPEAEGALAALAPGVAAMKFMDIHPVAILGADCLVSRSGYTGEDGFEMSIPNERAVELVEALLATDGVRPVGLGARDSLRLESGLCLYGNDIGPETTPVSAGLKWAIQKVRRADGERAGGFPGADVILPEFETGAPRRRVGLSPEGRAPVRAGALLYADESAADPIGEVTSGGFGPTVEAPVAMGYVVSEMAETDTPLYAEVRGRRLPLRVAALPFVPPHYKRG